MIDDPTRRRGPTRRSGRISMSAISMPSNIHMVLERKSTYFTIGGGVIQGVCSGRTPIHIEIKRKSTYFHIERGWIQGVSRGRSPDSSND